MSGIHVRVGIQQGGDDFCMAVLRRYIKGGKAVIVIGIHVGVGFQQGSDDSRRAGSKMLLAFYEATISLGGMQLSGELPIAQHLATDRMDAEERAATSVSPTFWRRSWSRSATTSS